MKVWNGASVFCLRQRTQACRHEGTHRLVGDGPVEQREPVLVRDVDVRLVLQQLVQAAQPDRVHPQHRRIAGVVLRPQVVLQLHQRRDHMRLVVLDGVVLSCFGVASHVKQPKKNEHGTSIRRGGLHTLPNTTTHAPWACSPSSPCAGPGSTRSASPSSPCAPYCWWGDAKTKPKPVSVTYTDPVQQSRTQHTHFSV